MAIRFSGKTQNPPSLANHVLLVAVFVLAFKKGYVAIETVDEQEGRAASQEENQDCNIRLLKLV
jgi:hypothetical protein